MYINLGYSDERVSSYTLQAHCLHECALSSVEAPGEVHGRTTPLISHI